MYPSPALQDAEADTLSVDPYFDIAGQRSVRLDRQVLGDPAAAANLLARQVSAAPNDLLAHVQRIHLLIDHGEPGALFAALVDLFIALGDKGLPLKRRMLALAANTLPKIQRITLEKRLESGLAAEDPALAAVRDSVLKAGLEGRVSIVQRNQAQATETEVSALEEAHSLLEYGQIDSAREVLERALRDSPTDEDLAGELLEIYRRETDPAPFEAMARWFLEHGHPLPRAWGEYRGREAGEG